MHKNLLTFLEVKLVRASMTLGHPLRLLYWLSLRVALFEFPHPADPIYGFLYMPEIPLVCLRHQLIPLLYI